MSIVPEDTVKEFWDIHGRPLGFEWDDLTDGEKSALCVRAAHNLADSVELFHYSITRYPHQKYMTNKRRFQPKSDGPEPIPDGVTLKQLLRSIETHLIKQAMARTDNNLYSAARLLKLSPSTLQSKLYKLGLKRR